MGWRSLIRLSETAKEGDRRESSGSEGEGSAVSFLISWRQALCPIDLANQKSSSDRELRLLRRRGDPVAGWAAKGCE
jgi:hypothetical protein